MERVPSGIHEIMDVRIVRPFSVDGSSSFSWLRKDVGRERYAAVVAEGVRACHLVPFHGRSAVKDMPCCRKLT